MTLPVNEERGEIALTIDDVELVLAADMEGLAALSAHMKCESLAEMGSKLLNTEVNAVMAGISCLTIKGDKEKAIRKLKLRHFPACATAFAAIINHHMKDDDAPKKEAAAEESRTTESPGGTGGSLRLAR